MWAKIALGLLVIGMYLAAGASDYNDAVAYDEYRQTQIERGY